ncbi:MAG: HEAT repeat domain-containing protein [Deltaproteobacteria bacterium]|nr:HEAT repeat domain-containing protein [Deltaproteobacteria bacterium]
MSHAPLGRLTLVCLLLLPLTAGSARAEEKRAPRPLDAATRDFHQQHLEIHITPDIPAGTVKGRVRLRFESTVDGLEVLRLHCVDTLVAAVRDSAGRSVKFALKKGVLHIPLRGALARGAVSSVEIEYTSKPRRGLYFHSPGELCPDRPQFMYSQGQSSDNRRWIPCYDQPDDRCSWDIHVTRPKALRSVSNGVLVGTEDKGETCIDHWQYAARAPTYLISLIVAPLETIRTKWRDVSVEFSALPGHTAALKTSLAETSNMLEFFSNYLEAPYPWPRYAQTYVWDFVYGGMENVTATTLNMRALHTQAARPNYRSEGLVAHELAHMWFGDLLTCRTWKHIWLNEGFATYFTDLFFEHRFGEDEFLLKRRGQNRGYLKGTPRASELKLEPDPRGDIPLELFGGKQYSRGAAILHNLRRHLGDDVFRDAIRAYVKRHRDNPVTSEELRTVTEAAAGVDLAWFWNQWVYGLGYPKLDVRYDGKAKQLIVRQTQKRGGGQGLFRIRVPIRWGKDGPITPLTIYRERHVFPMEAKGKFLRFGVGGDLLMQVTQHQSPGAWTAALAADPDLTGRMDAAEAMEEFGPVAIPALAKAVDEDAAWAVRKTCVEILGRLEGPGRDLTLLAAAKDADPRVREAAMDALASTSRAAAGSALVEAALKDPHPYVRAAAARGIGKLKVDDALGHLEALLRVDSHGDVIRTRALEGLKSLGKPEGIALAMPFVEYCWGKGATHRVRRAALDCMTALGPDDREVHAVVVPLLQDPYHNMRSWAAEACGKYKIEAAIPALRKVRDGDWNGGVKGAARKALKRLGWVEPKKKKKKP